MFNTGAVNFVPSGAGFHLVAGEGGQAARAGTRPGMGTHHALRLRIGTAVAIVLWRCALCTRQAGLHPHTVACSNNLAIAWDTWGTRLVGVWRQMHIRHMCMQQQGLAKLAPTMCTAHACKHRRHVQACALPTTPVLGDCPPATSGHAACLASGAMPCRYGSWQPHVPGIMRGGSAHCAASTRL